jgi:hypothetical protein
MPKGASHSKALICKALHEYIEKMNPQKRVIMTHPAASQWLSWSCDTMTHMS